jgi:hypothetical protein
LLHLGSLKMKAGWTGKWFHWVTLAWVDRCGEVSGATFYEINQLLGYPKICGKTDGRLFWGVYVWHCLTLVACASVIFGHLLFRVPHDPLIRDDPFFPWQRLFSMGFHYTPITASW